MAQLAGAVLHHERYAAQRIDVSARTPVVPGFRSLILEKTPLSESNLEPDGEVEEDVSIAARVYPVDAARKLDRQFRCWSRVVVAWAVALMVTTFLTVWT